MALLEDLEFQLMDIYAEDHEGEVSPSTSFYEYQSFPVYRNDQVFNIQEGDSFTFSGNVIFNCERFSINFIIENESRDVALHINPRLPQCYIVRNTKVNNRWGVEEVASPLPFTLLRGQDFSIQVLVTNSYYMISVNGQHFAKYQHRLPFKAVTTIEIKGDVAQVKMERTKVKVYPKRLRESKPKEIRVALTPQFNAEVYKDEHDGLSHIPREWKLVQMSTTLIPESPMLENSSEFKGLKMPFIGVIPQKSLYPGRFIRIEGRVKLLPQSFYINLQKGDSFWPHPLIPFHFNPRFSKQIGALGKAIVCRNAWYNGSWAIEERSELDTDFRPGKMFSLAIVSAKNAFEVYLNGKLITEFGYHVRPEEVDTVYIQGDIKLWDVTLESNRISESTSRRTFENPGFRPEY